MPKVNLRVALVEERFSTARVTDTDNSGLLFDLTRVRRLKTLATHPLPDSNAVAVKVGELALVEGPDEETGEAQRHEA